ncbi:DUF5954 family protein [Streptomyces sp. NPDC059698]|uniref:DUF5954 family protein n=1 Tax=unclassified Streptomyces TaxID=2593676 RepID=UPI00093FEC36|nr:DUF5954 family protein [Streptomyces sp. CB02366]OKJ33016.1 aromatic ring-opening dioxygenase LigA [Streptomyces sp. CB02366]
MDEHPVFPPDHLTINVTHRDDPLFGVAEADARAAFRAYPDIVVRGPLFGLAEQRPGDRPRWRLLGELECGAPQMARDELNSHLWFMAKDGTDDRAVRRSLLDAVARLETEPVDEVTAAGVRYRVVRADEFARIGDGRLEPPRPTDVDSEGWDPNTVEPSRSDGFVIDHAAAVGLGEGIDRAGLVSLAYTASRYPEAVRADSRKALTSHPGVVLLPPTFRVVERKEGSWGLVTGLHATPQDARRALVHHLKVYLPEVTRIDAEEAAVLARAAHQFARRKRPDQLLAGGRRFDVVRVGRMVRIGPDGPETPRPSDVDEDVPSKMHPTMDEHGVITADE